MSTQAAQPKRVLVTGSTGAIGEPVAQWLLSRGHYVRGFARRPSPGLEDYVTGDLSDQDAVRRAVEGMEVVIHLGAYPNDADFLDVLLEPNVRGLYHICDAAREFGVQRLSLASTMQTVTGHGWPERPIRIEEGPAPVNHYALTKVWAEDMGDMVARVHGISVVNVRIGWLPRNPGEADRLKASAIGPDAFFSHADAQRFYERVVESPNPGPGESVTVFATSKPARIERMDLEPARRILGYEPQDVWPNGLNYQYSL
ncbi:MAG: NAD(P)-dependent oxidoreductase [Caldilineaceae bacterium]|nr:NAD(P)-dependent oxidoreductase [Caldilineaceae bacterium]